MIKRKIKSTLIASTLINETTLNYCCPINSIKYKNSTARPLYIQWSSFILSIQAPSKYGQLTILFLIGIYV